MEIRKYWPKTISHGYIIIGNVEADDIRKFFNVSLADFLLVEGDIIQISKIRELIHWMNLKPHSSKIKLAFISKAENLNLQSANALLKTLEEPPPYSILILTTIAPEKVIATICSRLIKIRLNYQNIISQPDGYLGPDQISKLNIYERFNWISKAVESPDLEKFFNSWIDYYRSKLIKGENQTDILKSLFEAKDLLSTNVSLKLLLENIVLNF